MSREFGVVSEDSDTNKVKCYFQLSPNPLLVIPDYSLFLI